MQTVLYHTHTKNEDNTLIFDTQIVQKTDENYKSKFLECLFGCYKLLTDMKIPPFDSA